MPRVARWCTPPILGGSDDDSANAVTVDAAGNAYVTGATSSANFATTPGAFQTTIAPGTCTGFDANGDAFQFPCPDVFVMKLNAAGSAAIYSTLLGGAQRMPGVESRSIHPETRLLQALPARLTSRCYSQSKLVLV